MQTKLFVLAALFSAASMVAGQSSSSSSGSTSSPPTASQVGFYPSHTLVPQLTDSVLDLKGYGRRSKLYLIRHRGLRFRIAKRRHQKRRTINGFSQRCTQRFRHYRYWCCHTCGVTFWIQCSPNEPTELHRKRRFGSVRYCKQRSVRRCAPGYRNDRGSRCGSGRSARFCRYVVDERTALGS